MSDTRTIIESPYAIIEIDRNIPNAPMDGSGDVFISMQTNEEEGVRVRGVCEAIPADALRAAIDKAVGKREEPKEAKPYRPIDRDRLLRHIEDVEASLTRRNERHERDQARIRELEVALETSESKAKGLSSLTAREYLELAWGAAIEPEDDMIRVGEEYVLRSAGGRMEGPLLANWPVRASIGCERRLLEPRPKPTAEERRQAIIDEHDLDDWEIELLKGAA